MMDNNNNADINEKKNSNKLVVVLIIIACIIIVALSVVIVKLLIDRNKSKDDDLYYEEDNDIRDKSNNEDDSHEERGKSDSKLSDITGVWRIKLDGHDVGIYSYYRYQIVEIVDEGVIGYNNENVYGEGVDPLFKVGANDITVKEEDGITYYYFTVTDMPVYLLDGSHKDIVVDTEYRLYLTMDDGEERLGMDVKYLDDGSYRRVHLFKNQGAIKAGKENDIAPYVGTWLADPYEWAPDVYWCLTINEDGFGSNSEVNLGPDDFILYEYKKDDKYKSGAYIEYQECIGGGKSFMELEIIDNNTLRYSFDYGDGIMEIYFRKQ